MKKIFCRALLFLPALGFSQAITVNTATYTVQQLVNNVLINSPCHSASNIAWKTGTFYGAGNGIGYFQNTNPNFPMSAGVVLATTAVTGIPGPNTSYLNTTPSWPGNPVISSTLSISYQTQNATLLEFDFIPVSGYFSFDFLYASEEYSDNNLECNYSDRFVFLLTNTVTGVTKNLAVVPYTTIPASSVAIHNAVSGCPASNSQYFGQHHIGAEAAAASATNFNGETVVMKARSIVEPNVSYHLKMIIADYGDSVASSALFLGANSLNMGEEVLGPDLLAVSNNALCNENPYTLASGLNPVNYTFLWSKDGVAIPGETGPSLTITQPGIYSLTYENITCSTYTDNIKVEFQDCLGIDTPSLPKASLYPNPTAGRFTLAYPVTEKTMVTTTVTNILGQVIYRDSAQQSPGEAEKTISLENQPSGIYLVHLTDGKNSFNGKIIKK